VVVAKVEAGGVVLTLELPYHPESFFVNVARRVS
jgi:hypothetical protein